MGSGNLRSGVALRAPGLWVTSPVLTLVVAGMLVFGGGARGAEVLGLSSPAFEEGGQIPDRFTCDGADRSPPLRWRGVPEGARSLALIVDDPDAPNGTWVHWVAYNLPAESPGLKEGASGSLPASAVQGRNSWGHTGYGGPCPPSGTHRYVFKLYALDSRLELDAPKKAALLEAMKGHVLEQVTLTGRYPK